MTTTDVGAAAEAAALVMARTFGLGDEARVTDEWPVDDGDATLAVQLTGDALSGTMVLAVGSDVAVRLHADRSLLDAGFEAGRQELANRLGVVFASSPVADGTADAPAVRVAIFDDGQMTALVGIDLPLAGGDDDDPIDAHVAAYEPAVLGNDRPGGSGRGSTPLSVLNDVELVVTAELGRTTMHVRDLLELSPGMVVEIDRAAGSPIDLLVNGRRIAAGEVVVIDEEFGIRITEIAPPGERPR